MQKYQNFYIIRLLCMFHTDVYQTSNLYKVKTAIKQYLRLTKECKYVSKLVEFCTIFVTK